MGRNGGCDFRQWEKLKENLQATDNELALFIEGCAKELAARLLAKVIKRTPVGEYPSSSGKKGGTLRRGWTAGQDGKSAEYAKSLKVNHYGDTYQIEIVNPVEYASYVEFGHRTRNHSGWVEGKFMLTISEQEIETAAPAILERKIKKKLGECFK